MADAQRLERALRAAHSAGDSAAASRFARELRGASSPSVVSPQARPAVTRPDDIPVVTGQGQSGAPTLDAPHTVGPNVLGQTISDRSFQATDANIPQQIELAAGFLLNANPEARKDMLRDLFGDNVTFEQDEQGRDIVTYGNERAYLNKPGFDSRDALQLAGDVVKFAPAARFASWIGGPAMAIAGKGASAIRAALGGGAASGGTEALSQAATSAQGSEQGIDPLSVAGATAGGAVGELASGALQRLAPEGLSLVPRAQDAMRRIRGFGIDPSAPPADQVRQVARAGTGMSSPERGAAFPAVASGVRDARETARRGASELYDVAEQSKAAIPAEEVANLQSRVSREMDSFILEADGMSAVRRSMDALTELADDSIPFPRRIQALERWRRRVTAMDPADGSPAQAASRRMTDIYDEWMDNAFNNDMIRGDANAVQAWQNARGAWREYKQRFDSNRVVRDLAKKDTTPEQMSQWLFNTNAVGAKREAGLVVNQLNDILGVDSPQMAGLRAEVILDLSEPLMREVPDIDAFIRNYDKFLGKNPTLKGNLFPGDKGRDLQDLVTFAQSVSRRPGASAEAMKPNDLVGRAIGLVNRLYVGHGIARGGARVQTTNALANFIRRRTSGSSARINMLRDYLGIEPMQPLIPAPTAVGAGVAGMEDTPGDEQ